MKRPRELPARSARRASDPELMRRLAGGEISALGELYDRYQECVRRFVARATANAADVDDVVHATFLTAAQAARRYDGRDVCRPWLVGIALQLLRRRRHAMRRWFAVFSSLRAARHAAPDPRSTLHARGDLERALQELSEHAASCASCSAEGSREARSLPSAVRGGSAARRAFGRRRARQLRASHHPAGFRREEVEALAR